LFFCLHVPDSESKKIHQTCNRLVDTYNLTWKNCNQNRKNSLESIENNAGQIYIFIRQAPEISEVFEHPLQSKKFNLARKI